MVFSVPTGNDYSGDDYLVHSIEFVKSTTFQVDLTVKTTDFASDSLGGLVLSVPEGAQLAIGTDNGDGTWTLKAEDLASFEPSGDVFSVPLQITVAGDATVATPPTVSVVTATVADAAGNLLVKGDNSGNTLEGGEGNDILLGGDGNDTLIGGGGSDIYVTGGGNDTIEINLADSKAGDSDVVVDLGATDQINVKDLLTDDGSEVTLAPSGGDTVITADSNGATAGGTTQTVTVQNTENLVFDAAMDTIKINTGSESV
jgi:Ca2+-binding RTX toxin-like protein